MKFLIDKKTQKNICSNTQIKIDDVVGSIVLTIDNKVLFITDTVKDVTESYNIAERDGDCNC